MATLVKSSPSRWTNVTRRPVLIFRRCVRLIGAAQGVIASHTALERNVTDAGMAFVLIVTSPRCLKCRQETDNICTRQVSVEKIVLWTAKHRIILAADIPALSLFLLPPRSRRCRRSGTLTPAESKNKNTPRHERQFAQNE